MGASKRQRGSWRGLFLTVVCLVVVLAGGGGRPALAAPDPGELIDWAQKQLEQHGDDDQAREKLAIFLVNKAWEMKERPYEDLEPLFSKAAEFAPERADIQFSWGCLLVKNGNLEQALAKLEAAASAKPDEAEYQLALGSTYLKSMKYDQAIGPLERARSLNPKHFVTAFNLGVCYYEMRDLERAAKTWEEAAELPHGKADGDALRRHLQKVRQQQNTVDGGTKDENQRFLVHFAGDSKRDIGDNVMQLLDELFDQVTGDLSYRPEIQIAVVFFNTEDFHASNEAQKWVGGIAEGAKILVPLNVGYDLRAVRGILAHEFTHCIVNMRTNNRCPTWINEGLAQYSEYKARFGDPNALRPDYQDTFRRRVVRRKEILPLSMLEIRSNEVDHDTIQYKYIVSWLAIRFIIDRYNLSGVDELLTAIGEGNLAEVAVERATGLAFPTFQEEMYQWAQGLEE